MKHTNIAIFAYMSRGLRYSTDWFAPVDVLRMCALASEDVTGNIMLYRLSLQT